MDQLSPRARALLDAAHGVDEPLGGDLSRVRRGVLLRIGSAGFGATVFSLSLERAKALLGAAAPKLAAVVLMAVTGSAVFQRAQRRAEHVATAPTRAVVAPRVPSAPAATVSQPAPAQVALVADAPSVPPIRLRPRLARAEPAAPPPSVSSQLEGEMRWVRAADAALRAGNVGVAQGLLDGHAREFPSGALSEEREGLRIVAGCQSGDSEAGKHAALRFLERAPHSLLAGRVRAACPNLQASSGGG